ncbi:Isochorismatase hydrolase [Lizonia empirigonia]|nr:Isochorismatase hydrolase [Lizonia empirigonia]
MYRFTADESASLLDGRDSLDATFLRTPGYVSALKSPGLLDFLQEKGIQSLVLTGLSTSGCVLRTAVPATDAGFVVTVLSDACADQSRELHDILMDKVLPTRAHVTTATEFLQRYGG